MVLFSPPFVNESNPLVVFSSDPEQTCACDAIPNSAAATVLVDPTGSPSFMGTFTLYISDEQSELAGTMHSMLLQLMEWLLRMKLLFLC